MIGLNRVRIWVGRPLFGWWIVLGSVIILTIVDGSLTHAYGLYASEWRRDFGWSKTALAIGFAIYRGVSAVMAPMQGAMLDRLGSRSILCVGILSFGAGMVLMSRVSTLTELYLTVLLLSVGSSLTGPLTLSTIIVNWFERRRSFALAMMLTGFSIGGLIVPLIALSITENGWRATALLSGGFAVLFGLPIVRHLRRRPEEIGLRPDGDRAALRTGQPAPERPRILQRPQVGEFTPRQAMKTRAFWLLAVGHSLAVMLVSAVIVHLVVHLNEGAGFAVSTAATVVATVTLSMLIGQIAGGFLGDAYSKRKIASIAMIGHAAALVLLAKADSILHVLLFAIVHGVAWGLRGPQMQAIRADYFGRRSFGAIEGVSTMIVMSGHMAGPLLAGYVSDVTGSYVTSFLLLAGLAVVSSFMFAFAREPSLARS